MSEKHKEPVQWARNWGWNMFGVSLGTGAVSAAISSVPYAFSGQTELATIFLIMAILFWFFNIWMTVLRAVKHWRVFKQSFFDQTEAPWVGVSLMTAAPILVVIIQQGGPRTGNWLIQACEVCFYIYLVIAWVISWTLQNTFRRVPRRLGLVTATDLYEILPLLLCSVVGSTLCSEMVSLSPNRAFTMLIISLVLAGLGFWVSILKLSVWMVHHVTLVHAPASLLPTYMTAAAPAGFSALILTNLSQAALTIFPMVNAFRGVSMDTRQATDAFAMTGLWFAIFLMGLYIWVVLSWLPWGISHTAKNILHGRTGKYAMTCWSMTFPTLGYIACFGQFADLFPSKAFGVINIIGVFYLFFAWLVNICGTAYMLLWDCSPPGTAMEFDQDEHDEVLEGDWEPIRDYREIQRQIDSLRRRLGDDV